MSRIIFDDTFENKTGQFYLTYFFYLYAAIRSSKQSTSATYGCCTSAIAVLECAFGLGRVTSCAATMTNRNRSQPEAANTLSHTRLVDFCLGT